MGRQPMHPMTERDRRFALLVFLMAPGRLARSPTEAIMNPEEQPVVTERSSVRVRAGVTGHNVRYVLLASLALAIVLVGAVALLMGR